MIFTNRTQAGQLLGEKLRSLNFDRPCVLALPRGGVPIGAEIARLIGCDFDLLLVKKIGLPGHEELAVGAVGEAGEIVWQEDILSLYGLRPRDLAHEVERKRAEIETRLARFRAVKPALDFAGRDVIVVDDGLATGATMKAAALLARERGAKRIIVAVPVAPAQDNPELLRLIDDFVALSRPTPFFGVGQWYEDFTQVSDEEVLTILETKAGTASHVDKSVNIRVGTASLPGALRVPPHPKGLVIFAHGSGSTHTSPRNRKVADALVAQGFATLRFDLLTPAEAENRANVFNLPLLTSRLLGATKWARREKSVKGVPIGYFGASTGAAAALGAAAEDRKIQAVVSRGGRPDMALDQLAKVTAPTLLIVGGDDLPVIPLNEAAQAKLANSELVIIPGAGHLFEEAGTLDQVIEYAANWFQRHLGNDSGPKAERGRAEPREQILVEIEELARPARDVGDLDALIRRMSQARVVMLGEATHGTEEFYRYRRLISERLIRDYGFRFLAVEGDWPDCYKLNRYILNGDGGSAARIMEGFSRWPTWMWANHETETLIEWMRNNGGNFYGLDVYSLYESLDVLKAYAKRFAPPLSEKILAAYQCFHLHERSEISYARSLMQYPPGCEQEVSALLRDAFRTRLHSRDVSGEELFDLRQNATVITNAERYYRAMMKGGAESWNVRDNHMMNTLDLLLRRHGEAGRAIVWAHNTHIGDYHATDMLQEGYVNLGGLARERYGIENVFLLGFGSYEGHVLAGRAWDAPAEIMQLPRAAHGSYEDYCHQVAAARGWNEFYMDMSAYEPFTALHRKRGHRAVGVVYRSSTETRGSNYVPTELARRYDAFVFIDKTNALRRIATNQEKGLLPETWPIGI